MPETTNLFNCGDNKIKKFNTSQIIWRQHVWSIILRLSLRNLKLLFIECYPIKEEFLMPWTLTDITYEISQRKYIVTNSTDYDKYSDIVKRGVIDGKN